eukprot:2456547-Ditylum_brightwellii.AAC.1
MASNIGKLMDPWGIAHSYPHTRRLSHSLQGRVEVDCRPKWSRVAVLMAVKRGPHTSTLTPEAVTLVHKDMAYQVKAGVCEVMEWSQLA